jgi:menaquinone-dependent protoporphyrinogen IX oxidase
MDENKILIVYASNSGSTGDIAEWIADALREETSSGINNGTIADVRRIEEPIELSGYASVFIGGPMILGYHRKALKFIKTNRSLLTKKRVALFCTGIHLTVSEGSKTGSGVVIDKRVVKPQTHPDRLTFKERYTTIEHYLLAIYKALGPIKPESLGFFGGKIDYRNLKFPQVAFLMLFIGAKPGDLRDRELIQNWARGLKSEMIR